ncbi:MAG: sugar ABC transporter permease [Chloroflexi bacterium]|nr:sugar ABC transporter permease [Chloroflexota bacterium]
MREHSLPLIETGRLARVRGWLGRDRTQEVLAGYLFVGPAILGFLIFALGPLAASLYLGFTDYDLGEIHFIGLRNYTTMLSEDPLFWQSLKVTFIYTIFSVPLGLAAGFLVALLLNQRVRLLSVFRTIYYLPALVGGVAASMVWLWLFSRDFGLVNFFLSLVGIRGPSWLGSPTWVMPAFIIMSLWGVGGPMLIYLAGLQGIPSELYDAAKVDGAGPFGRLWHVTIPMMTPVIFFNLVMGIIGTFQVFTQAYVMTSGGPDNATLFYVLYLYQNGWQYFKMGYASALAWVLFLIILAFTALVFRSSPVWVYYEGEIRGRN